MKKFSTPRNSARITVLTLAATLGLANFAGAVLPPKHASAIPEVDVRTPAAGFTQNGKRNQGVAKLKRQVPDVAVSFDPLLGTPRSVQASSGFLTGPDGVGRGVSALAQSAAHPGQPDRPLKLFLDEHADLFGFGSAALASAATTRDAVGQHNGLRTRVWEQRLNGVPVFDARLVANITKNGELVNVSSRFLPALAGPAPVAAAAPTPTLTANQAIASALTSLGEPPGPGESVVTGTTPAGSPYEKFTVGTRSASARLVYLPMDAVTVRLAWEMYVKSRVTHGGFQILVDAASGETLVRRSLTQHLSDATYNVYTSESPSPFSPSWPAPNAGQPPLVNRALVTTNAFSVLASPNGWINDGDNETRGNNADVFVDRDFDSQPDGPRPQGNPARVFDFPLNLGQPPLSYSNAAAVQMFYKMNVYHDRLYELGFTEAFGNYQKDNFGRGGLGNDEIICYVQAGAGVGQSDNAFFTVSPDGVSGEIAMFIWSSPLPNRDGDLDSDVIFHEATHGTSWRLVGGGFALGNLQGDGMGEGWSDFYALAMSSEPADDPDAAYAMGGYVTYQLGGMTENYYYGIRNYPFSTDMTKNPSTYKDIDPTQASAHDGVPRSPLSPFDPSQVSEVHQQGEIWTMMLMEVRANLIRKHGGASGNQLALQLVTDGMKLTPATPTYVEARDAILLADQVNNAGDNASEIWRGFAKRGLGVGSTSPDPDTTTGVVESYSSPGLQWVSALVTGGNGNGSIDPNECNDLFLTLTNASGAAATSVKLTLAGSTPGLFVLVPVVNISVVAPGAVISNVGPFRVSTLPEYNCGSPAGFTLAVKSDQGINIEKFTLATGVIGTPVRFDSQSPVIIPDLAEVVSPITVSNIDGAIGKVTVALYLTHTFDSDLTLQLISPDQTTNTLAANVGSSGDNFGAGCSPDTLRTIFDDDATNSIASGTAPFVGTFRAQMPLSIFNAKSGTNVNGTWQLRVLDGSRSDSGALQCWSLFLSPSKCLDGGGFCPGTDLALGVTDEPDPVIIGNNLVYTLSVTNLGPSPASSTILSQNLPPGVLFLSATTTRGSVSHIAGVVTANLGNLSVGATATVTVTVLPALVGPNLSSAIVSSTEPEINPPNNVASISTLVKSPTADLVLSLSGAPNPAIVGGTLAYSATVLNNGPSTATGVVITNTLPASVLVTGASATQGSVTNNGNTVICTVGNLPNGATATATINTVPLQAGTIFAHAQTAGNQGDPVLANNFATISTAVGQAADLAMAIDDSPDPVVVNSNFTYTVTVTNRGPNPATSVVVNQSLPAAFTVISSNLSQGAVVIGGGSVVWAVNSIPVNGAVTLNLVGRSAATGTLNTAASVNASQTDPNLADNTASAATLVATPFVSIVAAGASLKTESFAPANGAVDAGETVTLDFRLRNAGNSPNTNVVATLLATGGVTSPSDPQTYGVLPPGGLPVATNFTFTANGTNGGTITATLQIFDGGVFLTNATYSFALPRQYNFTNPAVITIPSLGNASPYPSTIAVAGISGTVGQVTATLNDLNHSFAPDVDVLLVGPLGQQVMLMGSAGGASGVASANVTFTDTAAQPVPQNSQLASGSYQPANYNPAPAFPAPAPAAPYSSALSTFANVVPNGTWSLHLVDHATGDAGNVASGWSLGITVISLVNSVADLAVAGAVLPSPGQVGDYSTWTVTVTNRGPNLANGVVVTNTLSAGLALVSASSSSGETTTNGNVIVSSLGTFNTNGTAIVSIVAKVVGAGAASVTAQVASSEIDLNLANNAAVISASNTLPLADLAVGLVGEPALAITGSNLTFTVSATNAGPGKALGALVTLPLAPSLSFLSATNAKGSCVLSNNTVICSFGDLVSNETVTASIVVLAQAPATLTNTATASTLSTDSDSTDNQAAAVVLVTNPRPVIVAAGTAMIAESQRPANGAVDVGENVTIAFALTNAGQLDTASLNATLLSGGGVGSPSGPQNYGILAPGGPAAARNFSFTAPNSPGSTVTATLQLDDNGSPLGFVTFAFGLSRTTNFANPAPISIPNQGGAVPYPSIINVAGLTGVVGKVTITLNGFSHSFPSDVDALLVGPQGQQLMVMSDAGAGLAVTNLGLSFDDTAPAFLPASSVLTSGTFKPTDLEPGDVLPGPAPTGPRSPQLSVFNGTDPNGDWSLYVADDSSGDVGTLAGGWALNFTTIEPIGPVANLGIIAATGTPSEILTGDSVTYHIEVTNRGPADATSVTVTDNLPAGASFEFASASQGTHTTNGPGVVTFDLGPLAAGAGAQLTVVARAAIAGNALNAISIAGAQTDLEMSDNSAGVTTLVSTPVAATLEGIFDEPNQVFYINLTGQPNVTYILQRSPDLQVWSPIATNTAPVSGIIKFTDSASTAIPQHYYRALRAIAP